MNGTAGVVGGGVGGLAAALALVRTGWKVKLFERAPELRALGAGITLAPNAVRAIDWLGLGRELRTNGVAQGGAGLRTISGSWLMRAHIEELERRFGVPGFALHRADLLAMLAGALPEGTVHTGHQITSADAADGTVGYTGPEGPGVLTADLIVAADGIHSRTRSALFPEHPGPVHAGYATWRGVVPREAAAGTELGSVTETWGRGERFGIVPLADGRVYWYATISMPEGGLAGIGMDELARRFRGWHEPIPRLLAATPAGALLGHDIHSLEVPLPAYVSGRVALLGDAAHAVTPDLGQGAAQALEDAVTLAEALGGGGGLTRGLRAYDERRRPRTQRLVRVSALSGRFAQASGPVAAALRDTVARMIPTDVYLRAISDTLSWRPHGPDVPG